MKPLLPLLPLLLLPALAFADLARDVKAVAKEGVVYVVDADDEVLLDLGPKEPFLPASILKLVTALIAEEHLGYDSRFETHFHLQDGQLVVKGMGDPFLVSEELDLVVAQLKPLLPGGVSGVAIDDTFFAEDIVVPGVGRSDNTYDALNSATAVNFNTIFVRQQGGTYVSAEDQTPITPVAVEMARKRGVKGEDRVNLSSDKQVVRRYAAELIAAKLRGAGVEVGDGTGAAVAKGDPLYVHRSSKTVREVCGSLLYYSNNYIANQVFLAAGAKVKGAPATIAKAQEVAREFLGARPDLAGIEMLEGSGLSYDNRVTAPAMAAALERFEPHIDLLRQKHDTPNKTGTLAAVKSVAGYLDTKEHGRVRFVIALPTHNWNTRWTVVDLLRAAL